MLSVAPQVPQNELKSLGLQEMDNLLVTQLKFGRVISSILRSFSVSLKMNLNQNIYCLNADPSELAFYYAVNRVPTSLPCTISTITFSRLPLAI
ncbi:hypothetical protein Oweho_1694 [Owenweeksia hongkongensis DSM 17368]|uniref:Uncharacterized protein n=1 Tax=Owenweeksia hongkongensis (strain DSM 17368 / CIP 108786 / JCM 12287 / NRRL B-23963 / UST20020801) TaxID=926562 RepID=G8R0H8_OWEHD|nr:hypothetical protein Oweho_1694 [Owenweeksia hongkongensis DSM 17368]